jgi:hypothetical protein
VENLARLAEKALGARESVTKAALEKAKKLEAIARLVKGKS